MIDVSTKILLSLVVSLGLTLAGMYVHRRMTLRKTQIGAQGEEAPGAKLKNVLETELGELRESLLALVEAAGAERRRLAAEVERSSVLGAALKSAQGSLSLSHERIQGDRLTEHKRKVVTLLSEKGFSVEDISRELKLGELEVSLYLETSKEAAA